MYRLPELLLILSGLMSLSACVTSPAEKPAYTVDILNFSSTSRGAEKPVIAMIATPLEAKGPLPVIITQHGSSRDGIGFPGGEGRTDEYSTRLMREGTKRGFAVVALDAFYKTGIQPTEKTTFPNAHRYALDLKDILAKDLRFDRANLFFTGFSYGAGQVNKSVDIRTDFKSTPWRAVAAAEPGCNVISEPMKIPFPILIIKGSESHYYIEPCLYFERLLLAAGVNVTLAVIEGANHFFSTNGRITRGVAVNGCRFNPVIRKQSGRFQFADGTQATRGLVVQKCFTKESGAGKNRLLLDGVIDRVLNYFEKHRT
ncbi:MAG: hypothetical protein CBD27_04655 [Rhodospirillaceae bacterium TMED167]|nr:UBX domain protein [Rhodospirillaceae bacterium]OUW28352.1 MAG: hypothetical protein CBD27_04655 [Rhodospirillaceae bacterium TMED167]